MKDSFLELFLCPPAFEGSGDFSVDEFDDSFKWRDGKAVDESEGQS